MFLKVTIIYLVVMFSFIMFAPVITPHFIYRMQILNLTSSKSFMAFFLYPLAVLLVHYVSVLFRRFLNIRKFQYKVILFINGNIYRKTGYFDSGNTLVYKNLPVVFLSLDLFNEKQFLSYQKVNQDNLITSYIEGKIMINNKVKKVIFAHSSKNFNGCDCLLNALVI